MYRVKYGVSSKYKFTHIPGTYTEEPKNDPQIIVERCNKIKQRGSVLGIESLISVRNNNFAFHCCTGNVEYLIPRDSEQLQVKGKNISQDMVGNGVQTVVGNGTQKIIQWSFPKAVALVKNTGAGALVDVAGDSIEALTEKTVMSAGAFWSCIGVAAAVQIVYSGWKIHRYIEDPNILWQDIKLELMKGGATTLATSVVSILIFTLTTTNPAGWAFLASVGTMALVWSLFKLFYKEQSTKEKVFKERGLKLESSIKEKKAEIRLINKQINDERLHSDKWTDLPHKCVNIYTLYGVIPQRLDITIKCVVDEDGNEEDNVVIIDTVQSMSHYWIKGIRSGMVVYSINDCNVMDDTFDEIKEKFDALSGDINIGLFDPKKVNKVKAKRKAKYIWLQSVKKLINEDIYECRSKKKEKIIVEKKQKPSVPLAITL